MSQPERIFAAPACEPPPPSFEVRVEPHRGTVRVVPVGELDLATAQQLRDELAPLTGGGFDAVVIDLSELTFIDSTGLHLLAELRTTASRDGWELTIVHPSKQAHRLLELTGLATALLG